MSDAVTTNLFGVHGQGRDRARESSAAHSRLRAKDEQTLSAPVLRRSNRAGIMWGSDKPGPPRKASVPFRSSTRPGRRARGPMEDPVRKRPHRTRRAPVAVGIGQVTAVPFRLTPCDLPERPNAPRCTLLAMPREIDISNCEELYGAVLEAVDLRRGLLDVLVLDFTGTTFTDSRGARLISATREYAQESGVAVRLAAEEDGVVRRVITLTGTRRDVPVYATVAEAVRGTDTLGMP
ncbi:STAS domain-containing protein [Streptomyces sp. NPDC091272]|uniref:STAS domain-containing protein n=1 Tax=Streptomyces sp. NPDC091272 TaxID=3365981 RepID=UPI0038284660